MICNKYIDGLDGYAPPHHATRVCQDKGARAQTLSTTHCYARVFHLLGEIYRLKTLLAKAKCRSNLVFLSTKLVLLLARNKLFVGFAVVSLAYILGKHNKLVLSPQSQPSRGTQ